MGNIECLIVLAAWLWLFVPLTSAYAQDIPRSAQPPDTQGEVLHNVLNKAISDENIPARQAEQWSDQVVDYRLSQAAGEVQNRPPMPIPDAYATTEGVMLDIPAPGLIANDYHPDDISFILSNFFAPEHGTLPSIVTNGAFRYDPPPGFTGTDTFRYILRDAEGTFSEAITVTIEVFPDPNRHPIPVSDEYATLMDMTLDVPVPGLIANDIDPDGDTFILSNFFSPEHGTLPSIVTNGAFRYIPPPDFIGTDTFRYILRDSKGAFSDPDTVNIHVLPPGGDHPVAIPDHYVTTENQTLDIPAPGLIANDIDPDGDAIILANFFHPEHGTLPSIVTSGAFRYEPDPDFVGTDTFSYRLRNSKGNFSEFVTVTIEVLPDFNRPPIPIPDFYGIPENETLDISAPGLIANDLDPDEDSFILSNFFPPEHGTLPSIVTNGAFRYVPPPGFTGIDTFRYRLRDNNGAFSEFADVTIFVGIEPFEVPAPENLVLTEIDDGIELSWDISSTINLNSYNIYRGPAVGQLSVHDTVGPGTQMYTDSGLPAGPSIYAVTAVDGNENESLFSNIVSYYTVPLQVTEQWNLISLPVEQGELQLTNSQLYHFDQVYRSDSLLVPQKGYWIRSDDGETVEVRGAGAEQTILALEKGWNLIGSLIDSVDVESIADPSKILTAAPVFEYDGNGYQEVRFITPGRGYWIHAGQMGAIELDIHAEPSFSRLQRHITEDKTQPYEREPLKIIFSNGETEQLYFVTASPLNEQQKLRYLLPPKAPGSILDVRSRDGYRIGDEFPVELNISASSYPVRVFLAEAGNPAPGKVFQIVANHRGGQEKINLFPGEETFITREYETLFLHQVSEKELEIMVDETGIDPVYPNPFNAHTTIRYRLAGQTKVKLEIYDVIGRKIAVLADDEQSSGIYIHRIDTSNLASGLYFLRFHAGDFQNIQKLTLIK